jgi:hypothetical protein
MEARGDGDGDDAVAGLLGGVDNEEKDGHKGLVCDRRRAVWSRGGDNKLGRGGGRVSGKPELATDGCDINIE